MTLNTSTTRPVVVGRHGHAASQMTDDKVDLLIGSAQRRRSLPADGLLVQGVELAQAAEIGKARVVGHVRHLVHAHRIHEKGGDAHHVADAPGQIRPQVGGVLAVGRGLHVVHDPVVDGVGAGGDGPVQAAPAAHGGKVRQPKVALCHGVQNGLLAEVRLVNDPVEPVQLLGRVVNALLNSCSSSSKTAILVLVAPGLMINTFIGGLLSGTGFHRIT